MNDAAQTGDTAAKATLRADFTSAQQAYFKAASGMSAAEAANLPEFDSLVRASKALQAYYRK